MMNSPSASLEKTNKTRRLILFDLSLGGHHGSYIRHLADYWYAEKLPGCIDIIVLPKFMTIHSDTVKSISLRHNPNIKFIPITLEEESTLKPRNSRINRMIRNFQEWDIFFRYAVSLGSTQALIMYLDVCEIPLTFGKQAPCPFSGIYFRPTFHYSEFSDYISTRKQKIQEWREKFTLGRILRHPQLQNLFCLDPFAIKYIKKFPSKANVVYLPDPVETSLSLAINSIDLRKKLGVSSGRKIFLLFGALDARKGIYQLLDALQQLPVDLCQKICLLLVGGTHPSEQERIQDKSISLCQKKNIQIVECYDFIHEDEVPGYFQIADLVLAPYQQHVGMSGILLLAAAAGKPVLSSNYGLMGELVRCYHLGLSIDSTIPSEITKGLVQFLQESPEKFVDRAQMQSFCVQNSIECYTKTIFQYL